MQKSHPKMVNPKDIAGERRRRRNVQVFYPPVSAKNKVVCCNHFTELTDCVQLRKKLLTLAQRFLIFFLFFSFSGFFFFSSYLCNFFFFFFYINNSVTITFVSMKRNEFQWPAFALFVFSQFWRPLFRKKKKKLPCQTLSTCIILHHTNGVG